MELILEKIVNSVKDTEKIAIEFSKYPQNGDVVALIGNLGAGKTLFIKAFCKKFEIDDVVSPSFAIVNEYNVKRKIFHFDFYRLKNSQELLDIGYYDYLNDEDAVIFIEWADMFTEILPKKRYSINIKIIDENKRKISIYKL
ncbi:MAG: tRNA (adenosine(37)-N6)-threonylcarbamoyltransferase complex ATPase subunit type 1 TsaE [bacterium]